MQVADYQYLSEIRESNPPHRLGKPVHYRCANLADKKLLEGDASTAC